MEHDTLVLNEENKRDPDDSKRCIPSSLLCYNCEFEFFPRQGQGFYSPSHLNAARKEFCDVACQLAWAKVQLDEFEWPDYFEEICAYVGRRPYVPPSFEALQKFGGPLTIEEYKWGQRPQNYDISKRIRIGEEENNDMME